MLRAAQDITADEAVTFSDLGSLARAGGPCITVVVSIPNPLETTARFKNTIRGLEKKLNEVGMESEALRLIQPIRDFAASAETAGIWARSIAFCRAADLFRCFLLPEPAKEIISVEDRFQVRPLFAALAREQRFHVLALSRRNIRLFACTHHHAEESRLRGVAPHDMRAWMGTWKPDHVLNNRSTAGPAAGSLATGSLKGVAFTTSRDREREDQYLAHFFGEVDRGIEPLLRRDGAPLVLFGVKEDVTVYRRVATYPRLLERFIQGSPDGVEDHVIHERAREVVNEDKSEQLANTLAHFERRHDSLRVSSDFDQIISAAWEGRVSDFVFSEDAKLRGWFRETAREVEERPDGEDLVNAVALRTIQRGGQAFCLRKNEMPVAADVAAVFRF